MKYRKYFTENFHVLCSSRSLFSFRLQLHPSCFSINISTDDPYIYIYVYTYLFELKILFWHKCKNTPISDLFIFITQCYVHSYVEIAHSQIILTWSWSLKLAKFTLPNYTIYISTFVNQIYISDYLQYRQVIKISSNTIYSRDKFSSQLRHRATWLPIVSWI